MLVLPDGIICNRSSSYSWQLHRSSSKQDIHPVLLLLIKDHISMCRWHSWLLGDYSGFGIPVWTAHCVPIPCTHTAQAVVHVGLCNCLTKEQSVFWKSDSNCKALILCCYKGIWMVQYLQVLAATTDSHEQASHLMPSLPVCLWQLDPNTGILQVRFVFTESSKHHWLLCQKLMDASWVPHLAVWFCHLSWGNWLALG